MGVAIVVLAVAIRAAFEERSPELAAAPPSLPPEGTLSAVFETPDGRCAWARVAPPWDSPEVLAEMDGPCDQIQVSFAPDGARAMVWRVDVGQKFADLRLGEVLEVALADKRVTRVDAPGEFGILGYASDGRRLAMMAHVSRGTWMPQAVKPLFEEENEGPRIFLGSDRWVEQEVERNTIATPLGADVLRVVEEASRRGPPKAPLDVVEGFGIAWHVPVGGTEFLVRSSGAHPIGEAAFVAPLTPAERSHLERVRIDVLGNLVLLAGHTDGRVPRLYDVAQRKLVFSSDEAYAVRFWPAAQ